ncbi:malonic semialdehyde reductase [Alphaproteobacteria bacterium]|nr:malonic semialdehyde reductase [Alphaproteobacteria bacterium]
MSVSKGDPIDDYTLDRLFRDARTFDEFQDQVVPRELLQAAYELARMAPTSANCQPLRILFLQSTESRKRLAPALSSTNRGKTLAAPATAIIAYDLKFPATLPHLYRVPGAEKWFSSKELVAETAFRNGSLQGAYFMLAARAIGLDVGPMSGFDNAKVDATFFSSGNQASWRSNFICNLGFGDPAGLLPRDPRPKFLDACAVL